MPAVRKRLIGLALALLCWMSPSAQNNKSFEIMKNLEIFTAAYKQLHLLYVDQVNSGELIKAALDGMFKTLDPYTVYIPEAYAEDARIMTEGEYDGIGIAITKDEQDRCMVSDVLEDYAAHKADIRQGDIIISISGVKLQGKTSDDISELLKGYHGTVMSLVIQRGSETRHLDLVRERIKIKNVSYATMLDDTHGYIKLSAFTETASAEMLEAYKKLKQDGMSRLVIDLRDNPGGLMEEAIRIVSMFVSQNQSVVHMKGKIDELTKTYYTQQAPVDTTIPLIVLIDNGSASSSEIVAGALQDLDRALIVGQTSFGKGLVQQIHPLAYRAQMKITVAKYYIPSGRCVQAIDYLHEDKPADSLRTVYKTRHGREVYDGIGIEPDILLAPDSLSSFVYALAEQGWLFDFGTWYRNTHDSVAPLDHFFITDEVYQEFVTMADTGGFHFETQTEKAIHKLMQIARDEAYYDALSDVLVDLKESLSKDKASDFQKHKEVLSFVISSDLVSRYYYQSGFQKWFLKHDKILHQSLTYFDSIDRLLKP